MTNAVVVHVEIGCVKCGRSFRKVAKSLKFAWRTWDAFSHCDECESKLKGCHKCSGMRKLPYEGEPMERRLVGITK